MSVRSLRLVVTALLGTLALSGCGTIVNVVPFPESPQCEYYGGLRYDVEEIGNGDESLAYRGLVCIDAPVSFAFDTLLLPAYFFAQKKSE